MSAVIAAWQADLATEAAEATQSLAEAITAANEAQATAVTLQDQHREAAAALAALPSDLVLSRALSGRLEASRVAAEEGKRQALYTRRTADHAAARLAMLEVARNQLGMLMVQAEAENITALHPAKAA